MKIKYWTKLLEESESNLHNGMATGCILASGVLLPLAVHLSAKKTDLFNLVQLCWKHLIKLTQDGLTGHGKSQMMSNKPIPGHLGLC